MVKTIAYTYLIGDLFHYGHLRLLANAKKKADYHICGVIDDTTAKQWESILVCDYKERASVIESLKCVDEVIIQKSLDPTENLKIIHKRFPNAKVILFKGHQQFFQMPGVDYIKNIGGEIITPEYYPKLSRDNIVNAFTKSLNNISELSARSNFSLGRIENFDKKISTKANTLKKLRSLLKKSIIEDLFVFTVLQWQTNKEDILYHISSQFKNKTIIIRSSSLNEDQLNKSNAGYYSSYLNVNPGEKDVVKQTIEKIIKEYRIKDKTPEKNQVLIQAQTIGVKVSGVIFTRNPRLNSPYYLINYDDNSRSTDTVTSGMVGSKVEILRSTPNNKIPQRWRKLIDAVKELESYLSGMVLDIEFAITSKGQIVVFQVRPLVANRQYIASHDAEIEGNIIRFVKRVIELKCSTSVENHLYLSDMAFWNPAEIIGDLPNYLDYSLYNELILRNNWNKGITPLGYTEINEGLMELIGSKPYINVYYSFLSLSPKGIPDGLKQKLLSYYNNKLYKNPHLHDKVEFEIVLNCFDFSTNRKLKELENDFTDNEITSIKNELRNLTNKALRIFDDFAEKDSLNLKKLNRKHQELTKKYSHKITWRNALHYAIELIEVCKQYGTIEFSRAARFAFIGKSFIQSLIEIDPQNKDKYHEFFASIETVASDIEHSFLQLEIGKIDLNSFVKKFGHLRPGTYDITQPSYKNNTSYFNVNKKKNTHTKSFDKTIHNIKSVINQGIKNNITRFCKDAEIDCDAEHLLYFIKRSTQLREQFKFDFTKCLSLAMEFIALAGDKLGFDRMELAQLDYAVISLGADNTVLENDLKNIWKNLIVSRVTERKSNALVSLPPIIFSENDLYVVPSYNSVPNFITEKSVIGELIMLDTSQHTDMTDINNKIVVIEKADPGYDWIFTYNIKGLVTKYGGAASHMAIRCSEFSLPAAIGCGAELFQRISRCSKVILDCKKKKIDFV